MIAGDAKTIRDLLYITKPLKYIVIRLCLWVFVKLEFSAPSETQEGRVKSKCSCFSEKDSI